MRNQPRGRKIVVRDCSLLDSTSPPSGIEKMTVYTSLLLKSEKDALMDQTIEENGLPDKLSGCRSNNTVRRVTAPLRVIAGGLQPHHKQSQQRAQVRRFTTALNTTAALFAHEVASPLQGMSASLQLMECGLQTNHDALLTMRTFRREVDRLIILLNEFRSASVPRSVNLKSSDLREIVEEALAIQLIVYRNAGVKSDLTLRTACRRLS
jgi:nitrogen-specific signal transduction histidine kinase